MTANGWQRRIRRAQELMNQQPSAAEILGFYIHVTRWQEETFRQISGLANPHGSIGNELGERELSELGPRFASFLSLAETHGPQSLAQVSRDLRARGEERWSALLNDIWMARSPSDAPGYLALAVLQPYAEMLRAQAGPQPGRHVFCVCTFCGRKPVAGVLRQLGEGAARSLVCGFCSNQWEFRRVVCPACGEENDRKLPVFTASEFEYIRVECCDSCKTYIKTIDLTKSGHAEPLADEIASPSLDLWASQQGYAKVQRNLLGL
jgi:FdhE protein